jgi:hypothetical protein
MNICWVVPVDVDRLDVGDQRVSCLDRVNSSIAGSSIEHEFHVDHITAVARFPDELNARRDKRR